MVRLLDVQFRQRRVLFSSRMERSFRDFFSFLPNTCACGVLSEVMQDLRGVWEGLSALGLVQAKAKWLVEQLTKHVLAPLFRTREQVTARVFRPHNTVVVWSFVEVVSGCFAHRCF